MIGPAWGSLLGVVDIVHPIELEVVTRARRIVGAARALSARDAIHLAVMQRRGISRNLTFDAAFDGIVGVERVGSGSRHSAECSKARTDNAGPAPVA